MKQIHAHTRPDKVNFNHRIKAIELNGNKIMCNISAIVEWFLYMLFYIHTYLDEHKIYMEEIHVGFIILNKIHVKSIPS